MAVQKSRKSPSKRGMHRSHSALERPALSVEPQSGETHMRHRISPDGFYRGRRVIDIRHFGRGHSGADLVVHLPLEHVVISGDLVVWPVPLVGSTSFPTEYRASLERALELRPAIIVPGHGQVLRDDAYARLLVRLLASISEQTAAAVARGETLEQARKSVNLEEFRKQFAGDSQLKSFIFSFYVAGPGVAAAYREASAGK